KPRFERGFLCACAKRDPLLLLPAACGSGGVALQLRQHRRQPVRTGGRKMLGQADGLDEIRFRGHDFGAGRSEYTRSTKAIRPETMAESLAASKCMRAASPLGTSHTIDWQPCTRQASVLDSSGNGGNCLPRSIRYW